MLLTRRDRKLRGSAEQRGRLLPRLVCEFYDDFGAWSDDAEWWSWRPWPSNHRNELALGVAVTVDVPLRRLDRPMACQQLHVPQRAARLVNDASAPGDERPAAGVRRTAFQANVLERPVEPHDDAERPHPAATLRRDQING